MNDFKLCKANLVELSEEDCLRTEGGNFWVLLPFGIYLYDNREKFIQGVKDGLNDFA